MPDNRTLIAYGTRMGATAEAASEIAEVLRDNYGFEVDIVNLKENPSPNLERYRNVIVGSDVAYGKWVKAALRFLENSFEGKKVAIFVSSMMAGDPKSYDEASKRFVKDVLAKYPHIKPVAVEAFGGRIRFLGINFRDNLDMEKIRSWADGVGKKFSEPPPLTREELEKLERELGIDVDKRPLRLSIE